MKQIFLNSGTYTYNPLKGKLDLEAYILSVLTKDTCCAKVLAIDTITEQTAGAGVTVDGVLLKDGGISANSMYAGFYPTGAQNNITAGTGGAIGVTTYFTTINTDAGGDAFTLANGTQIGQMKKVLLAADGGGDATITLTGYTSIVMNDANDYVILMWNGTAWKVLENIGSTVNA